jgi:hypothetical protein
MDLNEFLQARDSGYDPEVCMVGEKLSSPGYHTTLENGTWVHPTREALEYAIALLREGSPPRVERARAVIARVLGLQDRDSVSATYGIWPWFFEESLSQMSPPDWNWADFQGLQLAEIIKEHGNAVADLRDGIKEALYHAGGSIYRRNVNAGYTNISVMGALVTSLIGEILEDKRIAEYGLRRLKRCVDHFEHHGGFAEYNSPVYTTVVLRDCEKGVRLLADPACREKVCYLLEAAWQTIADHFHPATHQWAGPHSRSYSTFLAPPFAELLEARTGFAIPSHPFEQSGHSSRVVLDEPSICKCPAGLAQRFRSLPHAKPYEIRRRFVNREPAELSTWGTTWFSQDACLGSVNGDAHWNQSRGLVAYWVGAAGEAVALRLRFLLDGKEFASVFLRNAQDGPRVLSAFSLMLNRGVYHPMFDTRKGNIFEAEDLRLRYELKGADVDAVQSGEQQFELRSGHWAARISVADAVFDGSPVPWKIEHGENFVSLDAICHQGARRQMTFPALGPVILSAGLYLADLRADKEPFLPVEVAHNAQNGTVRTSFGSLELTFPDHATPMPFG